MGNYASEIWAAFPEYHSQIISACAVILFSLAKYYLSPSVKLVWGNASSTYSKIPVNGVELGVYSEKFYLQNSGRKTALNVEFVFSHSPTSVTVWQPRDYKKNISPEGNFVITVPQIAPKELLIIDAVNSGQPVANVVSVKNGDCIGKNVNFQVMRNYGTTTNSIVALLTLAGGVFVLSYILNILTIWFSK